MSAGVITPADRVTVTSQRMDLWKSSLAQPPVCVGIQVEAAACVSCSSVHCRDNRYDRESELESGGDCSERTVRQINRNEAAK